MPGINVASAALIITAYMLPFGLFQLIFGYLADKFGKRQVISFSMVFFTISTGLCALGVGLTDLAIYRALTGVFAASVMPVSLALIGDIFPLKERQSAIGTFMGISFLGQGLSMAIGGSIAYFFNWRGVFVVYAVLAVLSTILLFTIGNLWGQANPIGLPLVMQEAKTTASIPTFIIFPPLNNSLGFVSLGNS